MTSWNAGEGFASLGIGHFIWYPKGVNGPYEESFPELVRFLAGNGKKLPAWLKAADDCPWNSKAEFQADIRSERMNELRTSSRRPFGSKVSSSLYGWRKRCRSCSQGAPENRREVIKARFEKLTESGNGTFAVIDYVNFKGEGRIQTSDIAGKGGACSRCSTEWKRGSRRFRRLASRRRGS
jgi:hypothetical protein